MKNLFLEPMGVLVSACRECPPTKTAVIHPTSAEALQGALAAAHLGVLEPILVGPTSQIMAVAEQHNLDISGLICVDTTSPEDSARQAAMMAGAGDVQSLMKGNVHTDVMMHAVLSAEAGLRTGRLLSHCALTVLPSYKRHVILTDIALNIQPSIEQKRDIIRNAVTLARALGVSLPKVALIAAVETVELKMPSTVDAAILSKMADRGQIKHCIVDGPIDLDAAVDAEAGRIKGLHSPVVGAADILVMSNIDAANAVYKALVFMAQAQMADILVGARVPIVLTSRADSVDIRLYSAAVAVLFSHALARDPSLLD